MNNVSVFLPTRKGSERVINKNTRPFADEQFGLLSLKIKQLLKVKRISEIVLSTNDPQSIEIGYIFSKNDERVKIIERPDELALSTTDLLDLVKYVPGICNEEHLLWTHVTSPFVDHEDYRKAIDSYFYNLDKGFDSMMSVRKFQNFLWSPETNDIVNRVNDKKWPRTQDLRALFEIDSAIFMASRKIYHKFNDRIGGRPYLYEQEGLKSFDVDWEEDYQLAELIHKKLTNE